MNKNEAINSVKNTYQCADSTSHAYRGYVCVTLLCTGVCLISVNLGHNVGTAG